jgi:hypothetical protein
MVILNVSGYQNFLDLEKNNSLILEKIICVKPFLISSVIPCNKHDTITN